MLSRDILLYLSIIELTCGLLIVSSTLFRTPYLDKLQKGKGKKFFIMGGLVVILKELLWILNIIASKEFLNAFAYIFIALGITNFNKYKHKRLKL